MLTASELVRTPKFHVPNYLFADNVEKVTVCDLIGRIINLLRERPQFVDDRVDADVPPNSGDNAFGAYAEQGRAAFIATLNRKNFPQKKLSARVISPRDRIPTARRATRLQE
jgi:hypothetical protein